MTFGPDRVIACPRCGAPERVFTLRTANNLWDSEWTDGYVHEPHHWRAPDVTRCHACRAFFWIADAPTLGMMPDLSRSGRNPFADDESEAAPEPPVPDAWTNSPRVSGYDLELLYEMIAAGVATTAERELRLRTLAFWRSSDRNRNPRRKKERQKTLADRRNMLALLDLRRRRFADLHEAEDGLVCAEIERQFGNFESALTWLNQTAVPEPCARWATEVRARPERGDRAVGWVKPMPRTEAPIDYDAWAQVYSLRRR
jgi:hypothetical protein